MRPGKLTAILLCVTVLFNGLFISQLLHSGNQSAPATSAAPLPEAAPSRRSQFNYLVVILMENNNLCDVLTSCGGSGTYMTQMASNFSLAKQYTAIDHPSLPNYLALTGANTFGCGGYDGGPNSNNCTSTAWSSSNIVDRVEAGGLTWKGYMENMPSNCYGSDSGNYTVRHDPFVYYSDIVNNQTRCNRVVPATAPLDPELVNDLKSTSTASNFMWLTPNLCNDMHNCSVSTGSAYLAALVPSILSSFIFTTQKAALLITFDEGSGSHPSDYVYTVWAGPTAKKAYSSSAQYSHYSLLKTLETVWGLQSLSSNDASANPMTEFLTTSTVSNPQSPIIIGWGGTRLVESVRYDSANPSSGVFPGEQASNQEMQARRLDSLGFNAYRTSFQSQCTSRLEMGSYDPSYLNRSIAIARHYNLWIIVDYHGYDDIASSSGVTCWLGFWKSVVQQFHNSYNRIVWEPINEPILPNNTDISSFSNDYQQWIGQARSLGDAHWIVVQNMCSSSCGFSNMADGYPTVTDSAGKVFISLHSYMGYSYYSSSWNNSTADSLAQQFYNAVVSGSQRTGWPVLNTEGGPDPQGINCSGGVSLPSPLCTPDQVLVGSAGYSIVTFHFIQTLTRLYDSNTPQRINWLWWPMGSWTDTPGAGLYGALATDGWGSLLQYQRVLLIGDVNGDGVVDMKDLQLVAQAYGKVQGEVGYNPSADIDHDGRIDLTDLVIVARNIGESLSIALALQNSPLSSSSFAS